MKKTKEFFLKRIPWIQGILASVLDYNFTGNFGVTTATVLVGPLDRQNTPFVIIHSLVLSERRNLASVWVKELKRGSAIFSLKRAITNRARTGISSVVVILTV
jgi:hypothetical protein